MLKFSNKLEQKVSVSKLSKKLEQKSACITNRGPNSWS
jgi:hypothetical protein